MNHAQVVDHELRLYNQFKAEGKQLLHFCPDWDDMAIHSEMDEIAACCCDFATEADNLLRDEKVAEIEERRQRENKEPMLMVAAETWENDPSNFSSLGAPAHSGTEVEASTYSAARIQELTEALRMAVEYMNSHRTENSRPYPLDHCEAILNK